MSDNGDANQVVKSDEDREREEEDELWQAFMQFDTDQLGKINTSDLKAAMELLGEKVTPFRTVHMISTVDPENNGTLAFAQFKYLVEQKRENERGSSDEDLLDAFVAMGGQPDGEGSIDADQLIRTIKKEFEMTINIEELIQAVDEDGSGEIEFDEFKMLLQSGAGSDDVEFQDDN